MAWAQGRLTTGGEQLREVVAVDAALGVRRRAQRARLGAAGVGLGTTDHRRVAEIDAAVACGALVVGEREDRQANQRDCRSGHDPDGHALAPAAETAPRRLLSRLLKVA